MEILEILGEVKLRAGPRASRRTRNRITEHPGGFHVEKISDINPIRQGHSAVLLTCLCGTHKEPWFGWLLIEEIKVEEIKVEEIKEIK